MPMIFDLGGAMIKFMVDTLPLTQSGRVVREWSRQTNNELKGLSGAMGGVSNAIGALSAAISTKFVGSMVTVAANIVESENMFNMALGNMADGVRKWTDQLSGAFMVNKFDMHRYVSSLYLVIQSLGVADEAAAKMSMALTQLAYDISSLRNIPFDVIFYKLQAGIVRETKPLRQIGINVNERMQQLAAFGMGIIDSPSAKMTEAQALFARFSIIVKGTQHDVGDLLRTMQSWMNMSRTLGEQWKLLQNLLGTTLMNASGSFLNVAINGTIMMQKWVVQNQQVATTIMLVVGGLIALSAALRIIPFLFVPIISLASAMTIGLVVGIGKTVLAMGTLGASLTALLASETAIAGAWGLATIAALAFGYAVRAALVQSYNPLITFRNIIVDIQTFLADIPNKWQQVSISLASLVSKAKVAAEAMNPWSGMTFNDVSARFKELDAAYAQERLAAIQASEDQIAMGEAIKKGLDAQVAGTKGFGNLWEVVVKQIVDDLGDAKKAIGDFSMVAKQEIAQETVSKMFNSSLVDEFDKKLGLVTQKSKELTLVWSGGSSLIPDWLRRGVETLGSSFMQWQTPRPEDMIRAAMDMQKDFMPGGKFSGEDASQLMLNRLKKAGLEYDTQIRQEIADLKELRAEIIANAQENKTTNASALAKVNEEISEKMKLLSGEAMLEKQLQELGINSNKSTADHLAKMLALAPAVAKTSEYYEALRDAIHKAMEELHPKVPIEDFFKAAGIESPEERAKKIASLQIAGIFGAGDPLVMAQITSQTKQMNQALRDAVAGETDLREAGVQSTRMYQEQQLQLDVMIARHQGDAAATALLTEQSKQLYRTYQDIVSGEIKYKNAGIETNVAIERQIQDLRDLLPAKQNDLLATKQITDQIDELNDRMEEAAARGKTFGDQISEGIGAGFRQLKREASTFYQTAKQGVLDLAETMKSSFADAFFGIISGTQSAKEAFRSMAQAVVKSIIEIIGKLLVQLMLQQALGMVGGAVGGALFGPVGAVAGSTVATAGGGSITNFAESRYLAPVSGDYTAGRLWVPNTGASMLYGGERVTPASDNSQKPERPLTLVNVITTEAVAAAMSSRAGKDVIINAIGRDAVSNGTTRKALRHANL